MDKRGPKSVAEQSLVMIPGQRPPPPAELEPAEQRYWVEITRRLSPDWFQAENAVLLKEYCRHLHYADVLAGMIAEALPDASDRTKRCAVDDELYALLKAHGLQSQRAERLATKLRLTPQSRLSARRADQLARQTPTVRPWEDWGRS